MEGGGKPVLGRKIRYSSKRKHID